MLSTKVMELETVNRELRETVEFLKKQFDIFKANQSIVNACKFCKFYHQHYGKIQGEYHALNCGHCSQLRIKPRKPEDKCEHFEVRERKE